MKKTHIIALVLIAASIGIIMSMVADSSSYQTFSAAALDQEQEFHVVGHLNKDKELHYDPLKDANYFSFFMKDKSGVEKKVVFYGTKPQDFERSEQIVLVGNMKNDEFIASKILMKCPSKYVDDQVELKEFKAKKV